ncbi:MAG: glycine cleavage system H protein [Thermacetogeniaceae bacterium]
MQLDKWLVPEDLHYDRKDYWVQPAAGEVVIGLTAYGQSVAGDVLYLELPPVGTLVRRGEVSGSIESGKWVGGLAPPVSGMVVEVNSDLEADPAGVNQDPYGAGWLIKVKLTDLSELDDLLSPGAYREWIEEQIRREREEAAVL